MRKLLIAPSLLSADFADLKKDIMKAQLAGADWLHFDVMDGHFVDNISFGIPVLKKVSNCHDMVNDVHLMISNPKHYAKRFIEAGADYLSFHYEACASDKEVFEIIDIIHTSGGKAGLVVKPNTPINVVFPFLSSLDYVLIMSVEPGFGGQSFIKETLGKAIELRRYISENLASDIDIEIDGGINDETAELAKAAGVNVLVAGSYLFGHDDIKERIRKLKK